MTQKLERQNRAYHRGNSGIGSATAKEETREISRGTPERRYSYGNHESVRRSESGCAAEYRRSAKPWEL
jgi:hypothetical protein